MESILPQFENASCVRNVCVDQRARLVAIGADIA